MFFRFLSDLQPSLIFFSISVICCLLCKVPSHALLHRFHQVNCLFIIWPLFSFFHRSNIPFSRVLLQFLESSHLRHLVLTKKYTFSHV